MWLKCCYLIFSSFLAALPPCLDQGVRRKQGLCDSFSMLAEMNCLIDTHISYFQTAALSQWELSGTFTWTKFSLCSHMVLFCLVFFNVYNLNKNLIPSQFWMEFLLFKHIFFIDWSFSCLVFSSSTNWRIWWKIWRVPLQMFQWRSHPLNPGLWWLFLGNPWFACAYTTPWAGDLNCSQCLDVSTLKTMEKRGNWAL